MQETQLMKGILEGCVLGIIAREETYGYQILQALEQSGFQNISEGTLYPVLTRLDKNGLILCRRAKSPYGPIRKYYRISPEGEEYYKQFRASFQTVIQCAQSILFPTEEET